LAVIAESNGEGSPIIHATVRNQSAGDLGLSLLSKSCNCFEVQLPTKPLAAGEAADISIRAPQAAGIHRISFTLCGTTAKGERIVKEATINLRVYPRQSITPSSVVQRVNGKRPSEFRLTFRLHTSESNPDEKQHALHVESLPEFLTVGPALALRREQLEAGITALDWEIAFKSLRDVTFGARGDANGRLAVKCDSLPAVLVPYHFSDADEIIVSPETILFDPVRVGKSATRAALVYVNQDNPISLGQPPSLPKTSAAQAQEEFSVDALESLAPAAPGGSRRFRVRIKFQPAQIGARHSELVLPISTGKGGSARLFARGNGLK
jgi:hypothetical protein